MTGHTRVNAAESTQPVPVPVAIIGMGCLFPGAGDLARYWANIRDRRDAIAEVPETHRARRRLLRPRSQGPRPDVCPPGRVPGAGRFPRA